MAEDDRSQLPLPSPGSPAEERKQRKSTSELREISEETYELRKTADGEYEKKTIKSERHERKTSQEETFVSTGLPSPTVSLTRWHEQLPERVKLEVSGVTAEGCPDASGLEADYILDLLDRRPERCRWEYTFRAKCQLFRCCLEAYPGSDGTLTLRAFFEGSVAGPAWTQTGLRDLSRKVMLAFDHQSAENPSAGCRWPETVTLTALATRAATKPFYISPEPTLREMAAMASAGSSSSSPPCELTGVTPSSSSVCHDPDAERVYTAEGTGALENTTWTTWPSGFADPETGTGKIFTTKWLYARTDLKVKATCCGTTKQAGVSITKLDRIEVHGTSDTGPKAVPVDTTVELAARASMGGSPWPNGQPTWEILSQPEGSSVTPSPTTGRVVEVTPTHVGTYRVRATCGSESDTFDVIGVGVTFTPHIVKTGYTVPASSSTIKVPATATVEPASQVENVEIVPGGAVPGRILIENVVRYSNGTIEFDVKGQSATPDDEPNGDTSVAAVLDGDICGEIPAIVLVPRSLTPVGANGSVSGVNQRANKETSPAYVGTLADGAVHLWTYYVHWLTIPVADQFGNTLAPYYQGAEVTEAQNEFSINQQISAFGTYQDPVGWPIDRPGQSNFPATHATALAWPGEDPLPLPDTDRTQNIIVQVGGHELQPVPAIANRRVITTAATNNVQIIWE